MKKAIREYYSDKHKVCAEISFEECFPGSPEKIDLSYRLSIPLGQAACLLVIIVAVLAYRGLAGHGPVAGDPGLREALQVNLEVGFMNSAVLGLSNTQARLLPMELDDFFAGAIKRAEAGGLDDVKVDLMDRLLTSRELALSNDQALAMTGLIGHWEPRLEDGLLVESNWMDDTELANFMVSCASHCHSADTLESVGYNELRGYLVDCLDSRSGAKCYTAIHRGAGSGVSIAKDQEKVKI